MTSSRWMVGWRSLALLLALTLGPAAAQTPDAAAEAEGASVESPAGTPAAEDPGAAPTPTDIPTAVTPGLLPPPMVTVDEEPSEEEPSDEETSDEEQPPQPALPTALTPRPETLNELLEVFRAPDPITRLDAVARISETARAELVPALRYIAFHDDSAEVALQATETLVSVGDDDAAASLADLARRSGRAPVWSTAITALGDAGRPATGALLLSLAETKELASDRRRLAIEELHEHYPSLVEAEGVPMVAGSRIVPALGGAAFGGYTLATVGTYSQVRGGPTLGFFGGALIGATTGFLLSENLATERSMFYLSAMFWGLHHGLFTSTAVSRFPDERATLSAGILGEFAGLGVALLVADALDYSANDLAYINLNAVAAVGLAWGMHGLLEPRDQRTGSALALAFSTAALAASGYTTSMTEFSYGDRALTFWGMAEGAWLGAWMPGLVERGDLAPSGLLLGASLGLVGSEVISQFTDYPVGEVGQMALTSIYGKSLGAGIALLARAEPTAITLTQLTLGLGGLGAMAVVGDRLQYSDGDYVLIPVSTAMGLWHGLAIGGYLGEQGLITGGQLAGFGLTFPAVFGLGAMAVSQVVDPQAWAVAMGSMGALWGAWFAAWSAALAGWDVDLALLTTLVASDVGLAVTGLLVSPLIGLDPTLIAGASVGGMALTGIATLVATLITEDGDAIIATNLAASGVGLLVGGFVTKVLVDESRTRVRRRTGGRWNPPRLAFAVQPALSPAGRADGVMLTVTAW